MMELVTVEVAQCVFRLRPRYAKDENQELLGKGRFGVVMAALDTATRESLFDDDTKSSSVSID